MEGKDKFRVLVIDDEDEVIQSFKLAFRKSWDIEGITHPDQLKEAMKTRFTKFGLFDLIFLDLLFDKSVKVSKTNVDEKIEKRELLGVQFLQWLQENYSCPVVVLSAYLFNEVFLKLRAEYPHILLKSKPLDLYAKDFRPNMEWYAQNFYRLKRQELFDKPAQEQLAKTDQLLHRKS